MSFTAFEIFFQLDFCQNAVPVIFLPPVSGSQTTDKESRFLCFACSPILMIFKEFTICHNNNSWNKFRPTISLSCVLVWIKIWQTQEFHFQNPRCCCCHLISKLKTFLSKYKWHIAKLTWSNHFIHVLAAKLRNDLLRDTFVKIPKTITTAITALSQRRRLLCTLPRRVSSASIPTLSRIFLMSLASGLSLPPRAASR